MKRKLMSFMIAGIIVITTVACSSSADTVESGSITSTIISDSSNNNSTTSMDALDSANIFSKRDKEIGYDERTSTKIELNNKTVTISEEGTYILSGTIANGQVIVDAPKDAKITIVLDNVTINNDTSSAIYVKQADKVFIILAQGSVNTLSNKSEFVAIDDNNIDGVIFSKEDLTINGQGKLVVKANYGNAIVSKDDLVITSGTYEITAANHGLEAKDAIKIADGNITITAQKDAIHSENEEDTSKGYIYIGGGELNLTSGSDAIDSTSIVQIDGGNITINSDDDGIHADLRVIINDGSIDIVNSYEGIEGEKIDINGGEINIVSSDDGINATSGSTTSVTDVQQNTKTTQESNGQVPNFEKGQMPPQLQSKQTPDFQNPQNPPENLTDEQIQEMKKRRGEKFENKQFSGEEMIRNGGFATVQENAYISISGGIITVVAEGDGLDSNGNIMISGGTTYVYGPTNSGNGSLDYDGTAIITGGTIVTAGASGMSQNFSSGSTQASMLINLSSPQSQNSTVKVQDSSGKTIISFVPSKQYSSLLISSPDIKEGQTYTITAGNLNQKVTMSNLIYNSGNMGFGMGGKRN